MSENPKFAVIGGGSWATAIAKMLCVNLPEIAWYMRNESAIDHIKAYKHNPNYLKYESESGKNGLAVFSEIYYPKGWMAFVDGKESEILRANYILRALSIPTGKHTVEFKFQPDAYVVGNKITSASSWLMLIVVVGCIGWTLKKE